MPQLHASFLLRYGCAVGSIALAIGIRLLLDPVLGLQFPFVTVYLAVLITAYYGGGRPALTAVVLGAVALDFFLLPPRLSFSLASPDQHVGMGLYLITGLGIALLAGSMHAAQWALRAANDELETRIGARTRELAEANEQLRAAEERSRLLVQGVSSHAIFLLDPAGNVLTWNPGAERIKGYKAEDIVGQHFARFYPPEDAARGQPQRDLRLAVEQGSYEEEGWRVRQGGSRFWAIVTLTPMYDRAPQPTGFVNVTRDITRRKELTDALEEAARFNRATLDGLSAHIAILAEDGTIIAVNKPWEDFAAANGQAAGTVSVGANYLEVCDRSAGPYSQESAPVAAGIRAVLAGALPFFGAEYPCDSPGESRWFFVRVTPFPSAGRRRAIVAHENITERKCGELALAERASLAALSADVGLALTSARSLRAALQSCAEALVGHLQAAFARIWIVNETEQVLELQASAGTYTHLDGPHGRVRIGQFKIGLIAQERQPHLTNDVLTDPRVSDPDWARREGMVAFAGYPLLVEERLVGVMAVLLHG